jgi:hypothetical protein
VTVTDPWIVLMVLGLAALIVPCGTLLLGQRARYDQQLELQEYERRWKSRADAIDVVSHPIRTLDR